MEGDVKMFRGDILPDSKKQAVYWHNSHVSQLFLCICQDIFTPFFLQVSSSLALSYCILFN